MSGTKPIPVMHDMPREEQAFMQLPILSRIFHTGALPKNCNCSMRSGSSSGSGGSSSHGSSSLSSRSSSCGPLVASSHSGTLFQYLSLCVSHSQILEHLTRSALGALTSAFYSQRVPLGQSAEIQATLIQVGFDLAATSQFAGRSVHNTCLCVK